MHRKIRYPQPQLTTQHSDLFIGNRDYETKTKQRLDKKIKGQRE